MERPAVPINRRLLILVALGLLLCLGGCNYRCRDRVLQHVDSPDRVHVATIYKRDCGMTGPSAGRVTLHPAGTRFDEEEDVIFRATYEQRVYVKWLDTKRVLVTCETCIQEDLLHQEEEHDGIQVLYHFPRMFRVPPPK